MNKKAAMTIDGNPICGGGTVKLRLLLAAAVAVSGALALDFLVDDRESLEIPRKAAMAIHGHLGDSNDIPAWGR